MNGLRKLTQSFSHETAARDSALVVLAMPHDCTRLVDVLNSMDLEIHRVGSCQQARLVLETHPPPRLIVTGVSLGDGNWCGLLRLTVKLGVGCPVILSCRAADERLWSEALWRGVYDLLIEPHEERQVRWIVEGALRALPSLASRPDSAAVRAGRAVGQESR